MSTETRSAATARSKHLRWTLLAGCVCLVIYGTLFPFTGWRMPADFPWLFHAALDDDVSGTDVLANVLLYMPLGFLPVLGRRLRTIAFVILAALVLSVCLETMQGFLPGRVTSWLDVAINVLGASLGAVAATMAGTIRSPDAAWYRDMAMRLRGDRVAWLGIAALVAWGCAQLIPFVPSLSVSNVKAGLKPVWHALQGSQSVSLWRCAVYVAATAALMVTGASVLRVLKWGGVAAICLLVVLPLKVLVVGRQLSPEALIGTCVGVALGLALWNGTRQRALVVAVLLVPAYWVAEALQPGTSNTAFHALNWIPLREQLTHPVNGMANMADTIWPSLALACLCLRSGMRSVWLLLPAVALLLFALECAQLWVPGRYPDITTVLVGTVAWAIAAAYAGRQAFRQHA